VRIVENESSDTSLFCNGARGPRMGEIFNLSEISFSHSKEGVRRKPELPRFPGQPTIFLRLEIVVSRLLSGRLGSNPHSVEAVSPVWIGVFPDASHREGKSQPATSPCLNLCCPRYTTQLQVVVLPWQGLNRFNQL